MRGKIDLGSHKLAHLYRAPARKSRGYYKRTKMQKMPGGQGGVYQRLWFIVDGAVRDTFANHPDYLTALGRRSATNSITKRVVGSLYGYATQVARGRSMLAVDASHDVAAATTDEAMTPRGRWMRAVSGFASRVRAVIHAHLGGVATPPEIHGGEDG